MASPSDRVRALVREGKVAEAEGARLLGAMEGKPAERRLGVALLWNPFDRFGGETAAIAGLVLVGLGAFAERFGVRYDGFLDLHVTKGAASPRAIAVDAFASWVLPALVLWGYTLAVARRGRIVDFLGVAGLSRLPQVLAAAPLVALVPSIDAQAKTMTPALAAMIVVALACVGWNITLLYNGFKNASGLRGAKLVAGFIAMLVVSEVLSKIALHLLA